MEFETQSGVRYYYDNEIGIAYPSHPLLEKMIRNDSLREKDLSAVPADENFLFYSRFLQKLKRIRPKKGRPKRHPLLPEEIKEMVLRDGLQQVTLSITEDCNLRCRYCVYSDVYTLSRKRSDKMMDFKTAKKALDWYVALYLEGREYNPVRSPAICFYGGEPLLNFDLIKKCVQYVKTTWPDMDFTFSMTTNGTLLNKEKEDFLKEHRFNISISIDGPKEDHDRNRVYPDGSGTHTDVMKNVRRMVADGYVSCRSLCVFDYKCDMSRLDAFFRQPEIPRLSNLTNPSLQNGSLFYNRYSDEDIRNFYDSEEKAFLSYLENPVLNPDKESCYEHLYSIFSGKLIYQPPIMVTPENRIIPYSGACILGKKFFVDAHGNFHACERVNEFFPLGNVDTGPDFKRMADVMNDYIKHLDACTSCSTSKLCGYCYNQFAREGNFQYASEICKNEVEIKKVDLSRAFSVGERHPQLIDSVVKEYYSWLSTVSPTLED